MADKDPQRERLIAERARALAVLLLTGRGDLNIEAADDVGLDLLVGLHSEGKPGIRQFGVGLYGALSSVRQEQAVKAVRPALQNVRRHGPFPFPVCLFFFTMKEPQSWWTWVAEPAVDTDGQVQLVPGEDACEPLDGRAISRIVEAVHRWYDALYSTLAASGSNNKRPKK
jgi:hypothetical protein